MSSSSQPLSNLTDQLVRVTTAHYAAATMTSMNSTFKLYPHIYEPKPIKVGQNPKTYKVQHDSD